MNYWMPILVTFIGTLSLAGLVWGSLSLAQSHKRKKLLSMRRQMKAQRELELAKQYGMVRAIDVLRLTREGDSKRIDALKLIESGQVVEGARALELLGLQRSAISALENHHKIDEAAEMLLRMNRPNRAGVLYQRNEMPKKAAECFLLANLPEDAARCFYEAGKWDSQCHIKAADLYENLGKLDLAFKALVEGGHFSHFVNLAFKYVNYQAVRDQMLKEQSARDIVALMEPHQIQKFIKSLKPDKDNIEQFAHWCQDTQSTLLLGACLKVLDPSDSIFFWKLFSEEFILEHLENVFLHCKELDTPEIRKAQSEALLASEHLKASAQIASSLNHESAA